MSYLEKYIADGKKIVDLFSDNRSTELNTQDGRVEFVKNYLRLHRIQNENYELFVRHLLSEMIEELQSQGKEILHDEDKGRSRLDLAGEKHIIIANDSPALIFGSNVEEAVNCFYSYLEYTEMIWLDAVSLYERGSYYSAKFMAIICMEEISKVDIAWYQLIPYIGMKFKHIQKNTKKKGFKDHNAKHIKSILSSLVLNSRVENIFNKKDLNDFLEKVENNHLENIRQNSIYFDTFGKSIHIPSKKISKKEASFYIAIAGEVMADMVHDPKERERIIDYVEKFELNNKIKKSVPQEHRKT